MKTLGSLIASIFYLYNVVYAFIFWGFWWGILNIFIPIAVIHDWVVKVGRF